MTYRLLYYALLCAPGLLFGAAIYLALRAAHWV